MQLKPRQIHLDFHTSGDIKGIADSFNPKIFGKTMKDAHVSSVTVFARCHHGYLYYPSTEFPELIHPHLKNKNFLLEQIDALHAEGINAPIYITVQWDYYAANHHPEWLIRNIDGSHQSSSFLEPGFYQSLCINTGYYDFLEKQTIDAINVVGDKLDGVFFDIVGIRSCYCSTCRKLMNEQGVDIHNPEQVRIFAKESLDRFKCKMSATVRKHSSNCTIFYNAGHIGPSTVASKDTYSHYEIESLPSGSWGYLHFPTSARFAKKLGKDSMGMTGKFHTEWGDFHSLKNLAALEFECFRMLSYGFAISIGDQLEPNGSPNPATYSLIGKVFKQVEEREDWASPSIWLAEAAIITPESLYSTDIPQSVLGAVQMLEELALQFDIIDPTMNFEDYRLLFLPDDLLADDKLQAKLDKYVSNGGKITAFANGGSNGTSYPESFGATLNGKTEQYPDFIIAKGHLANELEDDNEYVIYEQGVQLLPTGSSKTALFGRAPYFKREGSKFCSHRYTPSAKGESYPVAIQNDSVILFSHPIFTQYRLNAPRWCKLLVKNAISQLLPTTYIKHNGPSTMTVSLLEQPEKNRYCAHILSYIPVRKSATIDIIEEPTVLYNIDITVAVPNNIKSAKLAPSGEELAVENGTFTVPRVDGYTIIELNY